MCWTSWREGCMPAGAPVLAPGGPEKHEVIDLGLSCQQAPPAGMQQRRSRALVIEQRAHDHRGGTASWEITETDDTG